MNWRGFLISTLLGVLVWALIYRIPKLRNLILGT